MATTIEKTAAFLRQLMVKQAALLTLDSFLTKVAAALPVTKRAAFRVMQADLSSGNTLNHAIKVAFPRLSGEQRGVLAVNLCKCAADAEKNTRTFESYAVPVKEGNKMLREKCSMFDLEKMRLGGPSMEPRSAPMSDSTREFKDNLRMRDIQNRIADASSSPKTDPGYVPPPSRYVDDANPIRPDRDIPILPRKEPSYVPEPSKYVNDANPTRPTSNAPAKNEPAATSPIPEPTGGKFDLSSLLGQIGGYAQDPRVLGGLAAGGLGAYGLSRLLRRKKRRPELE
jgi:hypothetical protein